MNMYPSDHQPPTGAPESVFEASRDCMKILSLDGRLMSINESGMKSFEICDFASVQGSYWTEFWDESDRQACETALEAARNGNTGRFVGYFPAAQTHSGRWWDVVINPIFGPDGKPDKLLAVSRDVTEWKRSEDLLRAITEGTAAVTGTEFFRSLVKHLAQGLRVRWAFVAECLPNLRARSLAFWAGSDFDKNFEYALEGTPCMEVARGRTCHVPDRLAEVFPDDTGMIGMGTVSYLGVPLLNSAKQIIGHVVVFDDKPMPGDALALRVTETFAARAGVELERQQAEEKAQRLNEENTALLKINRAIGRHLDRDEMFAALADCLYSVVISDRFSIELPIEGGRLQGHILSPLAHSHRRGEADPYESAHGNTSNSARQKSSQPARGPYSQAIILQAHGTACDWVIQNREPLLVSFRDELSSRFPVTFEIMEKEHLQSLCALPLLTGENCLGAIFFMAKQPAAYRHLSQSFLEQVASTVAVALDDCLAHEEIIRLSEELAARKVAELELQKRRISDQLQQTSKALDASEERFRNLFDEAPIACVHEGRDTRFIRVNRTAMRILGIKPEDVAGTYGKSFVPDTPEAQRRLRQALDSIGKGTDTSGVVLELRRRDNGKPIWIQWWSRPDPGGSYTRAMFVDITERVLMEREKARLEAQNTYLQEEIRAEHDFTEIVGNSPALREVLRQAEQVAPTDSTVLILGETGTGKELIARAIHDRSPRKNHPLVKVNCGAISASLVESELFGHVKGAFTGALAHREGRFKLADGSTIFLDEVSELPMDTQVKLLRVMQDQQFEPIGSSKSIKVDVRIIAATNRDLSEAVRQGTFRSDLFCRLNVVPVSVPSLLSRAEDIPLLVKFFLQKFAKKFNKPVKQISEETMRRLAAYPWPGNIRELQNVIERAVVLSQGDTLVLSPDFGPPGEAAPEPTPTLRVTAPQSTPASANRTASLGEVERQHIESVLAQTNWTIEGEKGAAKILNLNPSTLRSRMRRLGIKRPAPGQQM